MAVDEIERLLAPSAAPAAFQGGSLAFIDALPTSAVVLSGMAGRNANVVSNTPGLLLTGDSPDTVLPLPDTNSKPDNRRWSPLGYDPGEIRRGAGRLVDSDWIPYEDPDRPGRRYFVDRDTGEIRFSPRVANKAYRNMEFSDAAHMWICLQRKIRKMMMFASGRAGYFYKPRRLNPFSKVRCD